MAKDFTDYILMVLDSGDRVYHQVHLRHQKGKLYNPELVDFKTAVPHGTSFIAQPVNGHKYLLNLDRAYRVKWAPWKKVLVRPAIKIKFKKKGVEYVKIKKPLFPLKVYATLKEFARSKKVGLLFYQEPCNHKCSKHPECQGDAPCHAPDFVEPMHISRIHQPSGEMKG